MIQKISIIIALGLCLPMTLWACDEESSSESNSDSVEINPFRQLPPPPPLVDLEMEYLSHHMEKLTLNEVDCSQYSRALDCHIHKCQEYYKILLEMQKIATFINSYPNCYGRPMLNQQFNSYIQYLQYVSQTKDEAYFKNGLAKQYTLPGGLIKHLPSTNFIPQALSNTSLQTFETAQATKNIIERLTQDTQNCLNFLILERFKFHHQLQHAMGV